MSERNHGRVKALLSATAKTTVFPFPALEGNPSGVTLAIIEKLPVSDGSLFSFSGHVLALHLGQPLPIRQRREDVSRAWTFTRGDLTLIPAGWQTTCWTNSTADFLQVELPPELVRRAAGESDRNTDLPCLFSFNDAVCRELSLSMVAEAETQGSAARMYIDSAAVLLAQRLLALKGRSMVAAAHRGLSPAVLRRATDFLRAEMSRNPGLAELSGAVGMSVHHFSRLFKRSTGLAPHQYLGNIRLERAKEMLADGRAQMIEIAYELGYANPSQFSAFFRKHTGLSPTEFRRSTQIVHPLWK